MGNAFKLANEKDISHDCKKSTLKVQSYKNRKERKRRESSIK